MLGRAKDSFDRLPREGLKGRLKAGVDALNRRLDPSESMLKCLTAAHRCTVAPAAGEAVVTTRCVDGCWDGMGWDGRRDGMDCRLLSPSRTHGPLAHDTTCGGLAAAAHARGVANDEANQPGGLTEAERELQLEVVYPAKLSGEQVRATLSQLVAARTKRHQNLAYGSTAMLPVSLAMGRLPGTYTRHTAHRALCPCSRMLVDRAQCTCA